MARRKLRYDRIAIAIVILVIIIFSIFSLVKGIISLFDYDENEKHQPVTANIETVEDKYDYTVIIDPGHGGHDGGTVNGDLYEKDIVLKMANEVREKLNDEENIEVILTRETDVALDRNKDNDLALRASFSAQYDADCFVSIHVNSFEDTSIRGFEIFKKDEESDSLAQSIMNELISLELTESRGIFEQSGLMVLRENTVKSVLVETGYISGDDYYYLRDDNQIKRIASAIARGIIHELNNNK